MDYYEDDFFNGYDSDPVGSGSGFDLSNKPGSVERNFDPLNFHDPVNSYLFLSDDVQDELANSQKRKLKCPSCGHEFLGQKTDHCPICYGTQFSQII